MRRILVPVLAAGMVLSLSALSRPKTTSTITIGAVYPTQDSQGVQGTSEARGVGLAVDWVNAHGGIHGHPVRLVLQPADRAEAVPSAMTALERQGIKVIIGSHSSELSAVAANIATRDHLLFWETGAVGQTDGTVAGGRDFFRMAPMGANLGSTAISFMGDELVPSMSITRSLRYAVAYVDDPYGRSVASGAVAEIQRRGVTLGGTFPYSLNGADYTNLATRIASAHPDVLFVAAYVDDGVALRRALLAERVPLVGLIGTSSSFCHPQFGAELGQDAVGLFASDKPDAADVRPDALRPEGRTSLAWANSRYVSRYAEAMDAPALSGFAGAYALLAHVVPKAQSTSDVPDVAAAALHVKLPVGTLANGAGMDFAPPGAPDAGSNRNASSVIWEWVAPRQRAVVWPPAFATHPFVAFPVSP